MSDFDDMYERGMVDKSGMPLWENNDKKYDYKHKNKENDAIYDKSNFKINNDNGIISLIIDLTPKVFLESKQLIFREELEKTNFMKVLNLKHNKYNNNDNYALEIYYNDIFIGHVRKKYKYEGIDNTLIINSFCFKKDLLKNLRVIYQNSQYIIENINPNIQEDEQINRLLAWGNKYNIISSLSYGGVLNLMNKQLTYLPEEIGNLTNLDTIYLEGNNITSLPKEIGKLINLRILDLSNNQLTYLPEEIGNLSNLNTIYLKGNNLTSLPKGIEKLINLEFLDLSNNQLTYLPEEIGKLTNLKNLNLKWNKLISLPKGIENLINLKSLDLKYNEISLSDFQLNLIEKFEKLGCKVYHNIAQLRKGMPPLTFNIFISIIITIATKSFYFLILGLILYIIGG